MKYDFTIPDLISNIEPLTVHSVNSVKELPKEANESDIYLVPSGSPDTYRALRLYMLATRIVEGGFDMYMYKNGSFEKIYKFWEAIEDEIKQEPVMKILFEEMDKDTENSEQLIKEMNL